MRKKRSTTQLREGNEKTNIYLAKIRGIKTANEVIKFLRDTVPDATFTTGYCHESETFILDFEDLNFDYKTELFKSPYNI